MTYQRTLWLFLPFLFAGCVVSRITPPHQPQALLLERGGELRASGRVSASASHTMSVRGQLAYAPVDGFAVAGAVDIDPVGDDEHYGGELAVAAFLPHNGHLRLEGMAGLGAGWTSGFGELLDDPDDPMSTVTTVDIDGNYLQPFLQAVVGFSVPYFEAGFGLRAWGSLIDVRAPSIGVSTGYERFFLSPFIQLAVPIDWFRFETTFAADLPVAGEAGPRGFGNDVGAADLSVIFGIGIQLDLFAHDPAYPGQD